MENNKKRMMMMKNKIFMIDLNLFLLEQHKNRQHISFNSFDDAVDEYFSKIDEKEKEKEIVNCKY